MLNSARHFVPAAAAAALLLGAGPALADAAAPGQIRVDLNGASSQMLTLPRGKSAIVELPVDARDVLVSAPNVAEVALRTPRRIFILGMASGQTDAVFFDHTGRRILSLNIRVDADIAALQDTLRRVVPGSAIHAEAAGENLILTGEVASAADSDRAERVARQYVAKPEMVLNALSIAGKEQVMLKVRVVEVQRTVIKQLGFNTQAIINQLGEPQYLLGNTATFGINGSLLGGLTGGYKLDTTKQPITNPDVSEVFESLSRFLGGGALSGQEASRIANYLGGLLPTITATDPATGATVTQATAGVTAGNLPSFLQRFRANDPTLTTGQQAFLRSVEAQAPNYLASQGYSWSPQSTFLNRGNKAAGVGVDRAGSAGLNQAQGLIQAFERAGLVRTLAEPNLTAISGESAKFLAGGEFPIPVGQDSDGRITIQFKPFGVGLGFTPVVLSEGRISLRISTEVSELSNQGAFTLVGGVSIPALNVRRAETTVELPSGGAIMMAGMLQSRSKQNLDKVPGLNEIPVLGSLFRSRDFLNDETELAIIVTPYLVKPNSPSRLQTPADGIQIAKDARTIFLGKLNETYQPSAVGSAAAAAPAYQGPVGPVIE